MTVIDIRPKTISNAQVIGEQGAAVVKERAHDMGFLFSTYGQVEAGIDGLIELRDSLTGEVGGRLVAVQVKTRDDRRYTAETDDAFEYLCEPEDVGYWQQSNLPVIVVMVRLSDRSAYWKLVPKTGAASDIETRRLRIDKSTDKFDKDAADAIIQLAVDQAEPGVWVPPSRQTDQLFFNAVKVLLPETVQVAATTYRHGRDALKALLELTDNPPFEWAARGGRLITFLDIENSLLRHVVDTGSIEVLPVDEFALHDDDDEYRFFVELLYRTLRSQLDPKLMWSRDLRLYYFPAATPGIDRKYRYMSLKNETSRDVVKAKRRPDNSIAYVRHSAFRPQFCRSFDEWYLTITPSYVFTWDGVRRDRYAGERISKLKRLENNASIRGQFLMWRSLLTGMGKEPRQQDLLKPDVEAETPLVRFEALEALELPVSVPDDLWSSRDVNPPEGNDEELPL